MKNSKSVRWTPALVIMLLSTAALLWIWFFAETIRQNQVIWTMATALITVLALLIWSTLLSRFRPKIRLSILGVFIVAVVLFITLFRFKELSGDLVPIFEPKWAARSNILPSDKPFTKLSHTDIIATPKSGYPQFLGPQRNAKIADTELNTQWDKNPPQKVWRQPIGKAWSSFAVVGVRAITQEQYGNEERVVCYHLLTGKSIWQHSDKTRFETVLAGVGPRATPTIVDGKVFSVGATGILNCLDLKTGQLLWQTNILEENNAPLPLYGLSGSPLVVDSLVIVAPGGQTGSLVAYHKDTGRRIWASGKEAVGYSSPVLVELAGKSQVLIFNGAFVAANAPETGNLLWQFPWPPETQNVAQPVILADDRVLITSGYGVGSKMLKVTRTGENFAVSVLWESNRLKSKFANAIYHAGFIYGLDDGIMTCLNPEDGKRLWKRGRYGHGQLLLIGEILLVQAESGDVALVETNPDDFIELARYPAIEGKTWNHPAFAAPYLLVRNSDEAACYKLDLKSIGTH